MTLHPEDRLNVNFIAGLLEVGPSVADGVISDRGAVHAEVAYAPGEVYWPLGAVEK